LPILYKCPLCNKEFYRRELARDHIKAEHSAQVQLVISRLSEDKLRGLKKRNVDLENWAAGQILSYATMAGGKG
jgi:hypothetical protein